MDLIASFDRLISYGSMLSHAGLIDFKYGRILVNNPNENVVFVNSGSVAARYMIKACLMSYNSRAWRMEFSRNLIGISLDIYQNNIEMIDYTYNIDEEVNK